MRIYSRNGLFAPDHCLYDDSCRQRAVCARARHADVTGRAPRHARICRAAQGTRDGAGARPALTPAPAPPAQLLASIIEQLKSSPSAMMEPARVERMCVRHMRVGHADVAAPDAGPVGRRHTREN